MRFISYWTKVLQFGPFIWCCKQTHATRNYFVWCKHILPISKTGLVWHTILFTKIKDKRCPRSLGSQTPGALAGITFLLHEVYWLFYYYGVYYTILITGKGNLIWTMSDIIKVRFRNLDYGQNLLYNSISTSHAAVVLSNWGSLPKLECQCGFQWFFWVHFSLLSEKKNILHFCSRNLELVSEHISFL